MDVNKELKVLVKIKKNGGVGGVGSGGWGSR